MPWLTCGAGFYTKAGSEEHELIKRQSSECEWLVTVPYPDLVDYIVFSAEADIPEVSVDFLKAVGVDYSGIRFRRVGAQATDTVVELA